MLKTVTIAVLNGCLVHATLQQIDEALTSYFNDTGLFRDIGDFPGVSQVKDYGKFYKIDFQLFYFLKNQLNCQFCFTAAGVIFRKARKWRSW